MKGLRMRCLLAVVVALLVAAPSFAQAPIVIKGQAPDGTTKIVKVNQDGVMSSQNISPDAYILYNYPTLINNRLSAGNRDSSAAVSFLGANHIYLFITLTPDSNTCNVVFALKINRHMTSAVDSISTFPVTRGVSLLYASNAVGQWIWNASTDTIGTAGNVQPVASDTTLYPNELLFAVPTSGASGGDRHAMLSFELQDKVGPITGPYLSFEIRPLAVKGTTSCTAKRIPNVSATPPFGSCSFLVAAMGTR